MPIAIPRHILLGFRTTSLDLVSPVSPVYEALSIQQYIYVYSSAAYSVSISLVQWKNGLPFFISQLDGNLTLSANWQFANSSDWT
jgi:hypothetical protein